MRPAKLHCLLLIHRFDFLHGLDAFCSACPILPEIASPEAHASSDHIEAGICCEICVLTANKLPTLEPADL